MQPRLRELLSTAAGALTASIGIVVLLGWLLGSSRLVELHPRFQPMHYGMALCLTLLGWGLFSLVRGARRFALGLAAAASVVGLAYLLQEVAGAEWGINRLLKGPAVWQAADYPRAMTSGVSITFLLIAIGLALTALRWPYRSVSGALLAGWSLLLGSTVLIVYFLSLLIYFDPTRRPAVPAGVAFALLGAGLAVRALQGSETSPIGAALRLRVSLGYTFALILLIGIALASQLAIQRGAETERMVSSGLHVRAEIAELSSLVKDVQRAQRGFMLTGEESYLEPYREASQQIPARIAGLKASISDPGQRERLGNLEAMLQSHVEVHGKLIEAYRQRGQKAAIEQLRSVPGERFREIQAQVEAMQAFQDDLVKRRTALSARTGQITSQVNLVGILLAIGVVLGGLVILFRGLKAREQAEQEVRQLNQELTERSAVQAALNEELATVNRELESFSYSVSHDLRAPLRHMVGFAQILKEDFGATMPAEAHSYLDRVQESGARMGALIDGLLNLSQLGRKALASQRVNLERLVAEIRETHADSRAKRRVEWRVGRLPEVQGDPQLLRQVLENLISNALKYSRSKDPARIEIGCERRDNGDVFFVRDNGVGFDMKFAHKLFGVFQRLHSGAEFEGTGIGLATVQRIIHRHGGKIWAESAPAQGTTFYFTLPVANFEQAVVDLAVVQGGGL